MSTTKSLKYQPLNAIKLCYCVF